MFSRIDKITQVKSLSQGCIIVKYPLDSNTIMPSIDLSDLSNYLVYEISSISEDLVNINLTIPNNKLPEIITLFGFTTNGILNNPTSFQTTASKVIADGHWWVWKQ
jgi:hypothetical protein